MFSSARSSVALVAVAALAIAGCGDDDSSSGGELNEADRALAAAVSADLVADDEEGFSDVFDVECMGVQLVTALGGAAVAEEKYGFTVETASEMEDVPMERADAERVVAGYEKCGDFNELLVKSFTSFGATEDEAKCVVDALPAGSIKESIIVQLTDPTGESGDDPLDEALGEAAVACGVG